MAGRIIPRVVAGIALAVALAIGSPDAHATSLAELTIEQTTDASTYIVEGRVDEVWAELDEHGYVWTRARVSVSATHKGPDQPATLIVDTMGGRYGDLVTHVPSSAVFSVGEDVFLFLYESETRLSPVGMFQGKFTVRRAPGETRRHVMTWQSSRDTEFDARFLPHPSPENRVYLDDLRLRVDDRLDAGWDGQLIPGLSAERLQQLNTPAVRHPAPTGTISNPATSQGSKP